MPLFPTLNDLKGISISINPLNLFDIKPPTPGGGGASNEDTPTGASPSTPRVGEAGPGPSSLSNRNLNGSANGVPSPLGNGANGSAVRPRKVTKQNSSDSSSGGDGSGARPRPGLGERRSSSQVIIRANEPRRRERKKRVPMDVSAGDSAKRRPKS